MRFTNAEKKRMMELGISKQAIYNWERGQGISMRLLPTVAKAMQITTDELIAQLIKEHHLETP